MRISESHKLKTLLIKESARIETEAYKALSLKPGEGGPHSAYMAGFVHGMDRLRICALALLDAKSK